jgi:hypothetical protein
MNSTAAAGPPAKGLSFAHLVGPLRGEPGSSFYETVNSRIWSDFDVHLNAWRIEPEGVIALVRRNGLTRFVPRSPSPFMVDAITLVQLPSILLASVPVR